MSVPIFVGRRRLLEECRQTIDAGLGVHLLGEPGVGKTALARRISSEAFYVAAAPVREFLAVLLLLCWERGWHDTGETEERDAAEKLIRKLNARDAQTAALAALRPHRPVLVIDDFDIAPPALVRVVRLLADVALVVVCSTEPRPSQKPFLATLICKPVPRLTTRDMEELTGRLLSAANVDDKARAGILRHVSEAANGLPSIAVQLVTRAKKRGDMTLLGIRRDDLSGARYVDMTPGLLIVGVGVTVAHVLFRGGSDHDLTLLLGVGSGVFMLARLLMFRMNRTTRRTR